MLDTNNKRRMRNFRKGGIRMTKTEQVIRYIMEYVRTHNLQAGERVTITAKVKGKGRDWFTLEATSASGKWSGGFPKQRFPLKEEWNEAKVELRIVDFKKIPTGKITVLFGADNGSELFLSDLKMVSAAQ